MLDADAVINNSSQKVGGSNAYPDPAPKKVGGSGPRKTRRIYAPGNNNKQICIAPLGRNFRGAGARQRASEQRKKRKPGKRGMSLA